MSNIAYVVTCIRMFRELPKQLQGSNFTNKMRQSKFKGR